MDFKNEAISVIHAYNEAKCKKVNEPTRDWEWNQARDLRRYLTMTPL